MYDGFTGVLDRHGDKIVKQQRQVVAYEITDINKKIVLDFKNKGMVYMHDPKQPIYEPDLTLYMKKDAFDEICDGKLGGMKGVISGRIKFKGSLGNLKNFDSNVVKTYFGPDLRPIK